MAYLNEALGMMDAGSTSTVQKGSDFERLMRKALEEHTGEYGDMRFKKVWLWYDWPDRDGPDTGIDLVAEQHDGTLCAIQCKRHSLDHVLSLGDIDSFIARSNVGDFTARILVYTGADLGTNTTKRLDGVNPRIELINRFELDTWVADWRAVIGQHDEFKPNSPEPYKPREYQKEAIEAIVNGFVRTDKGKLILPCGTGKSVVHLWLAERLLGKGGKVLYLVPSLSLMSQTIREWVTQRDRSVIHRYFGVCSDTTVGKNSEDFSLSEIHVPVTTDPNQILEKLNNTESNAMTVVFCTYQSLAAVAEAQQRGAKKFDLVICDEAHRTAGVEDLNTEVATKEANKSGFRLVHDVDKIQATRRLYSTATPRVYTQAVKSRIASNHPEHNIYSMDDESKYGSEFYRMSFADAIDVHKCLSDYEVIAIGIDEGDPAIQQALDNPDALEESTGLPFDDAVRLVGCWDALADPTTQGPTRYKDRKTGTVSSTKEHAKRAIAFSNTIKQSKQVKSAIQRLVEKSRSNEDLLNVDIRHIDGKMSAIARAQEINWLREAENSNNECSVLTNAKCLTEGVDVPALDAILLLSPRNSRIDIIQMVGRVMRQAEGKDCGYIILPVLLPEGKRMEDVLDDEDFSQVFAVLRALRAHDERMDAWVNSADLTKRTPLLRIIDPHATSDKDTDDEDEALHRVLQLALPLPLSDVIASKIVNVCGDSQWWPRWAAQAKKILEDVDVALKDKIERSVEAKEAFEMYVAEMRTAIHAGVDDEELRSVLAQHVVTYPVFEAIFERGGGGEERVILQVTQ